MLRVWFPPRYDDAANSVKRYPVLYMFDGQALFDSCTAPDSTEWQVDEALTRLIEEGEVAPMIASDNKASDKVGPISHNLISGGRRRIGHLSGFRQPSAVGRPEFLWALESILAVPALTGGFVTAENLGQLAELIRREHSD